MISEVELTFKLMDYVNIVDIKYDPNFTMAKSLSLKEMNPINGNAALRYLQVNGIRHQQTKLM